VTGTKDKWFYALLAATAAIFAYLIGYIFSSLRRRSCKRAAWRRRSSIFTCRGLRDVPVRRGVLPLERGVSIQPDGPRATRRLARVRIARWSSA
jgi:hypothetical protein